MQVLFPFYQHSNDNIRMKHALLFLERNMGSDYEIACPPLSPLLSWWLQTQVLHKAQRKLSSDGYPAVLDWDEPSSNLPSEGKTSLFIGCFFVVYSLRVQPDTRCTDPHAKDPHFTLHAVFPRNLDFISTGFQTFLAKCRAIGWNTFKPGRVEALRIPIPESLFLQKH